jgi:hypothetical protein
LGPWQKIQRVLSIGFLGLGLVALGLVVMGRDGEALRAYQRLTGPDFVLEALPGSQSDPVRLNQTATGPEWVQMCRSERSVAQIITEYEDVATKQAMRLSPELAPYIKREQGHIGMISWIDSEGRRLGVVAFPLISSKLSRYVLFQAGAMGQRREDTPILPLGLTAPPGSRTHFDFRQLDHSMSYCEIPGSPQKVLLDLEKRLEDAGCHLDRSTNHFLEKRGKGFDQVALRFEKGDKVGYLTLSSGQQPGSTNMSLIVRKK